ncbi:hypothetical protein GOARA_088_00010 [Gordonia araii NBRC 100433]|uniref:Uncharacterized protein n=1 Tax=Gordonia araii NBRC 100433 TaxID=1073574 RepID=G7H7B3_9ACTN|nr:hypothetical protein [Gordonia araii]NNG98421.1 hypothetical protein [Gordonia araii NBRC 100433]GAB11738.1 hypothetical protein GOARA_088_00010 [Gordonia araii NBRC 100433]
MHYVILLALTVAVVYILWRVTRTPGDTPTTPRPTAPRGPIGPDDDPDFLLDLRRKNQNRDS